MILGTFKFSRVLFHDPLLFLFLGFKDQGLVSNFVFFSFFEILFYFFVDLKLLSCCFSLIVVDGGKWRRFHLRS